MLKMRYKAFDLRVHSPRNIVVLTAHHSVVVAIIRLLNVRNIIPELQLLRKVPGQNSPAAVRDGLQASSAAVVVVLDTTHGDGDRGGGGGGGGGPAVGQAEPRLGLLGPGLGRGGLLGCQPLVVLVGVLFVVFKMRFTPAVDLVRLAPRLDLLVAGHAVEKVVQVLLLVLQVRLL